MESNQEPLGGTNENEPLTPVGGEANGSPASAALPHVVVVVEGGQVQSVFGNYPFRFTVKDFDHIEAGDEFIPTLDAFKDGDVFGSDEFLEELSADL